MIRQRLFATLLNINIHQFDEEESQESAAAETVETDTSGDNDQNDGADDKTPDLNNKFEEMITGEYKDAFHSRTQEIIDKRFAKSKDLEQKYNDMEPSFNRMSEALKSKYSTETVEEALSKFEAESIENEAYERGVDIEVVKKERETASTIRELKETNKSLVEEKNTFHEREKQVEQIRKWKSEETELQKTYPDFKLLEAASNEKFAKLLNTGTIDMKTAYEVAFPESLVARVEGGIVKDPNRGRPSENAGETKNSGQFTLSKSVSDLTPKERADLAERAKRGEKITL